MKRSFLLFFFLCLVLTTGVFTSCNNDDDDPSPDDCAISTFPPSTGTATVNFKNFSNDPNTDGIIDVNTAAGDYLSIAVEINKGSGNRPQKLRVYSTSCANQKGTQITFSGQPNTNNEGTIDLRNTDQQVRTILYQVPSGNATLYLNFEVDESGSKYTYKRMKLNVSGSGEIASYSDITLGAQANAGASRMSSGTGETYVACSAAQNLEYIDITYSESGSPTAIPYLSSNPARALAPISLTNTNPTGCGDGDETTTVWSTAGGTDTYFKDVSAYISSTEFNTATETTMDTIVITTSYNQYVAVGSNKVYAFKNTIGGTTKKGLILVNAGGFSPGSGAGSIVVDVKVQR